MKILKRLFLAALLCLAPIGAAFAAADSAVVVPACGTAPATYVVGQVYAQTMDTTGRICGAAVTSGGGTVTQPTYIGDTVLQPSAFAVNGLPGAVPAGAATQAITLKATTGNFYSAYAYSPTNAFLMVFNSTAVVNIPASPVHGIALNNVQDCIPIQAGTASSISYNPAPPEIFANGITIAISSGASCDVYTAQTTGFLHGSAK